MSIFEKKNLKPQNVFQKLFKTLPKKNFPIELENYLSLIVFSVNKFILSPAFFQLNLPETTTPVVGLSLPVVNAYLKLTLLDNPVLRLLISNHKSI